MRKIQKMLEIIKDNGLKNGGVIIFNKLKNKIKKQTPLVSKIDILSFYSFVTFDKRESKLKRPININNPRILWFIPDFGIGSGGHLNIFRMIYNLEKLGVHSDIVICGDTQWGNVEIAKEILNKHFFKVNANIFILKRESEIDQLENYDIAMATSWQTAYYVNRFANCYKKSYFVQDFEPYFTAMGSVSSFSEQTYKFGFYGITAGSWLSKKLEEEYSMSCKPFSFSYDRELYEVHKRNDLNKKHIFFYARPPTERRAFELGLLVLNRVTQKRKDISVIFAGWDISNIHIPFHHLNEGVVKLDELSHLYSQCDVALVLSFTNLSLLPLELLASGCPVVTNKGHNNDWIDKDKKLFIYSDSDVESLANNLLDVIDKRTNLDFDYINHFLSTTSWEKEAKIVKNIINSILRD